jgi:hypothetical protein
VTRQRIRDSAIEERGGELDRVARHDSEGERVEPTRAPRMPRPIGGHDVVVDAVALRLLEGAV